MKKITKISIIILSLLIALLFAGCNETGESDSSSNELTSSEISSGNSESSTPAETINNYIPQSLDNPDISIFIPYELSTVIENSVKEFEELFGGKVTVLTSPWDIKEIKLTTYISTNEAPDVVSIWFQDMPKYAVKGILQPISDIEENNSFYDYKIMDDIFSFNGEVYAITGRTAPVLLFFNNTMIKNAGLKSPLEYYNEDNWNWDTFRDLSYDLTEDTTGDGINDIVGFGTWIDGVFLTSNGTDLIKYEDNKPVLNVTDPKFTQAMQFYSDMFNTDKSIQTEHWSWYEGFKQKKVAMFVERSYIAENLKKDGFSDEFDFAPFPKGAGASELKNHIMPDGWGIGKSAENLEASKAFINILMQENNKYTNNPPEEVANVFTTEQRELINYLSENTVAPLFEGYGNMWTKFIAYTDDIRENNPVGTTTAKFTPIFQKEIDMTLEGKR